MTSRRPLRAVLFDVGNTLVRMNYAAIAACLAGLGHRVSAAQVEDAELRARVRLDADLARGRSTESPAVQERYLAYLLEPLGVTDPAELAAVAQWRRGFNRPAGVFDRAAPDAAVALARVRGAGLRAGVVSNSDGAVGAILAGLGLAGAVDVVVDSGLVGVEKPDPRIFRLAAARVGVDPGEAAYVGDLYSVDVLGARAAGLGAVLLDPRGYWGARDCPIAPGVGAAVELLLDGG